MNPLRIRCSSIGDIMTDPRSKSEALSKTAQKAAIAAYIQERYGRSKEFTSKYTDKGNAVEEDAITMLSVADRALYLKNETRYSNDWLTGTPDLLTDSEVIDLKSSWDIFTFYDAKMGEIDKGYWWQLQGYMALTGRTSARLVYALCDTPEHVRQREIYRIYSAFGYPYTVGMPMDNVSAECVAALDEAERLFRYGDIPEAERLHTFHVEADPDAIARVYERVELLRAWVKENL